MPALILAPSLARVSACAGGESDSASYRLDPAGPIWANLAEQTWGGIGAAWPLGPRWFGGFAASADCLYVFGGESNFGGNIPNLLQHSHM